MADTRPFLLVHGAWHGPWCWEEHWTGYFENAGHQVEALQLAAHDRPGNHQRIWSTIGGHVTRVRARLADLGPRTVLVGHSMGGLVVQRALEGTDRTKAAGAVLVASVPRQGVSRAVLRLIRRQPPTMLRTITTANLWPVIGNETLARRAFFTPDTPSEVVESTLRRLQNESFRSILSLMVRPPRPSQVRGRVPVHVMAAENDGFFTLTEQHDLAQAYSTTLHLVPGGHDVMLDTHWAAAAADVLRWADALDLGR